MSTEKNLTTIEKVIFLKSVDIFEHATIEHLGRIAGLTEEVSVNVFRRFAEFARLQSHTKRDFGVVDENVTAPTSESCEPDRTTYGKRPEPFRYRVIEDHEIPGRSA